MYRNAADFCVLIFFYPETLLNVLINSNNFLVESLGFSLYKIIAPSNNNFTIPFQFEALFKKKKQTGSSHCGTAGLVTSLEHWDSGLTPGLAQWVKDPVLL